MISVPRYGATIAAVMPMTKPLLVSLALLTPTACRPASVSQGAQPSGRAADGPAEASQSPALAEAEDVLDEPFVFTIGGMKKINGAL